MSITDRERLTGPQKGAVLCMALGSEQAARVMQHLTPNEVEVVTREIAALRSVGSATVDLVLKEYADVSRAVESVARGGVDVARDILEQAMGANRAKTILDRIQDQLSETGLRRLRKTGPDVLLSVLRGEHPQTVALILAHLDVRQAATVIEMMDAELASDILLRVARMDKVSPEMLALVEQGLAGKADLSLSQEMTLSGGPSAVADVLNLTPASLEKTLLETIAATDAELAEQIKSLMFVFEDLKLLEARSIQRVLRDVDSKELALALKAASDELKQHITKNMSERAASALLEEMEYLGAVKVKEVEAAHARILQTVRQLEEAGEIVIASRGGDDDVIL
jgi:flagellar motor switch protein FliG